MAYCERVILENGDVGFIRRSGSRPPKCAFCPKVSTKLCDFVVSSPQQVTHKKTCSLPMCDDHAQSVGPDRDYCPKHKTREPGE